MKTYGALSFFKTRADGVSLRHSLLVSLFPGDRLRYGDWVCVDTGFVWLSAHLMVHLSSLIGVTMRYDLTCLLSSLSDSFTVVLSNAELLSLLVSDRSVCVFVEERCDAVVKMLEIVCQRGGIVIANFEPISRDCLRIKASVNESNIALSTDHSTVSIKYIT